MLHNYILYHFFYKKGENYMRSYDELKLETKETIERIEEKLKEYREKIYIAKLDKVKKQVYILLEEVWLDLAKIDFFKW